MLTHLRALRDALADTDTAKVLSFAADADGWTDTDEFATFCDENPGVEQSAWNGCDLWEADLGCWTGSVEDGHYYPTICLTEAGRALAAMLQTDAAAEIERLTAALDAAPVREERKGECWCADGFRWGEYGTGMLSDFVVAPAGLPDGVQPRWCSPVQDEHVCTYCPDCGAHLGADGIARRWRERGEE